MKTELGYIRLRKTADIDVIEEPQKRNCIKKKQTTKTKITREIIIVVVNMTVRW